MCLNSFPPSAKVSLTAFNVEGFPSYSKTFQGCDFYVTTRHAWFQYGHVRARIHYESPHFYVYSQRECRAPTSELLLPRQHFRGWRGDKSCLPLLLDHVSRILSSLLVFSRAGLLLGGGECFERSVWFFLPDESGAIVPFLSLVVHSLPKCPKPWHSERNASCICVFLEREV